MNLQFDNRLAHSFILWLDNKILSQGQGYVNQSTQLFFMPDSSRPYNYWSSPYKSWVYDSSATGANIPSGFYNSSGQFLTRNSGIGMDFINGRVFSSGNWGPTLSGQYAKKEYNIYYSDINTVNFYLERLYDSNGNIQYDLTGILPYNFNAPCVIVTNSYSTNRPFAFGGQKANERQFRLYTLSNNNFNQDALNTIILDSLNFSFPLVDNADLPINFNGDLKTGYYSYNDIIDKYNLPGVYIKNVYSFKLSEKDNRNIGYSIGIYEFDLETIRISYT